MSILYLCNSFAPFHGGVARFGTEVCLSFARLGHEVTVLTEDLGEVPSRLRSLRIIAYQGVRNKGKPVAMAQRNVGAYGRLRKELRSSAYDAVLVGTWRTFGSMMVAMRRRFLLFAYGSEIATPLVRGGVMLPWLRTVCQGAACVACISRFTERMVHRVAGSRCPPTGVIGCGVDPEFWRRSKDVRASTSERSILSVGTLSERKGFDSTIRAFARSHYSKYGRLVIVGTGPRESELRRLAADEGVADKTVFLRLIPDGQLAELYGTADVFMLLNRVVRGDYEGFGIVFLEAGLHELPVIGGNNGGVTDAIEDGRSGFLVDPEDIDGIADLLNELFRDSVKARSLGRYGRRRALERFTWDRVAERVLALASDPGAGGGGEVTGGTD